MSKADGLVGLVIAGSAALGGISYGEIAANSGEMPKLMYIIPPLLALGGFILGAKPSSPKGEFDQGVGGVYAGVTAAIFGTTLGLTYLVETLAR